MKRLMIIGLWPDDVVKYCTEKCDCRRYAFDRIIYHRGGRAARERICIPVVDRSGAVTTYLDLPVTLLEAGVVYLRLDDGSDIFLSDTQMVLIANEVERRRAELAGTGLKTLGKWFESGLPTAEDYLEPGDEVDADLIGYFLDVLPPRTNRAGLLQVGGEISTAKDGNGRWLPTYLTFKRHSRYCQGTGTRPGHTRQLSNAQERSYLLCLHFDVEQLHAAVYTVLGNLAGSFASRGQRDGLNLTLGDVTAILELGIVAEESCLVGLRFHS